MASGALDEIFRGCKEEGYPLLALPQHRSSQNNLYLQVACGAIPGIGGMDRRDAGVGVGVEVQRWATESRPRWVS